MIVGLRVEGALAVHHMAYQFHRHLVEPRVFLHQLLDLAPVLRGFGMGEGIVRRQRRRCEVERHRATVGDWLDRRDDRRIMRRHRRRGREHFAQILRRLRRDRCPGRLVGCGRSHRRSAFDGGLALRRHGGDRGTGSTGRRPGERGRRCGSLRFGDLRRGSDGRPARRFRHNRHRLGQVKLEAGIGAGSRGRLGEVLRMRRPARRRAAAKRRR